MFVAVFSKKYSLNTAENLEFFTQGSSEKTERGRHLLDKSEDEHKETRRCILDSHDEKNNHINIKI